MAEFIKLYSAITGEWFENNYLTPDGNYLLHKRVIEGDWRIVPYKTDFDLFNGFYTKFPNGIYAKTKKECLKIFNNGI